VCGDPECLAVFFICASCDRGHRYCSPHCRERDGGNSGVARTAATSKARKDGSIIATASGNIGGVAGKCKSA
jgi:hypothetical protein